MLKEEKKVEYLELIYDLIFVYVIGRNSSLLRELQNGFVPWQMFLAYVLCSLAVIQIWNYSTFYINMFGRNKVRDHIALFLNMYLLYYIGEGTRVHWQSFQTQYHVAWALILINTGVQYFIERRNHTHDPDAQSVCSRMMIPLFGEAASCSARMARLSLLRRQFFSASSGRGAFPTAARPAASTSRT